MKTIVKTTGRSLFALAAISLLILSAGCSDRDIDELNPASGNTDPVVFADGYGDDVYYQGFFETHYTAASIDSVFAYGGYSFDGAKSLKIQVPPVGSALGMYAGGVLTSAGARDLSDYNALTFYARASESITLNEVGFGNDNTGDSMYGVSRSSIGLGSEWTFVVVPIPDPAKLVSERGLFLFAEGAEIDAGYDMWFDEIRFATIGNAEVFRPSFTSASSPYFIGSEVTISGSRTIYRIDGGYVPVDHSANYFTYSSSDESVAVYEGGVVSVVGAGTAIVSATLGEAEVQGAIEVVGYEPPSEAAPAPTHPAGNVISLFSDAYTNHPVDTWRADWGGVTTQVSDYPIGGNATKMYSSLNWVGVTFSTVMVDASEMTHLHFDVYAPAGENFNVKLVSYIDGETGVETTDLVSNADSTPALTTGQWCSLDIPLENFNLPEGDWDWSHIGQMVLSGSTSLVLVDNVYFHN